MQGYQVTFYTQLNIKQDGTPIDQWLLNTAKTLNLRGATVLRAYQGLDHLGKLHSVGFFELVDQPVLIQFILTSTETETLLVYLKQHEVSLFFVKQPVEFGITYEKEPDEFK